MSDVQRVHFGVCSSPSIGSEAKNFHAMTARWYARVGSKLLDTATVLGSWGHRMYSIIPSILPGHYGLLRAVRVSRSSRHTDSKFSKISSCPRSVGVYNILGYSAAPFWPLISLQIPSHAVISRAPDSGVAFRAALRTLSIDRIA